MVDKAILPLDATPGLQAKTRQEAHHNATGMQDPNVRIVAQKLQHHVDAGQRVKDKVLEELVECQQQRQDSAAQQNQLHKK